MKNMIKLPAVVLGLMLLLTGTSQRAMAQDEDISLQSFYDELSPYGTWIQDSQYGYVWRPDADQGDFRPYYTNGRWAMTEYGNTWVSNYDWGWAPFHYGRWVYNRYNQWVWIPDTQWGPAWVSWRSGGGYYGWAPMGPGMNVNINFSIPDLWWVFVPQRNIYYDNFPRYYSRRNLTIINNTTIINNVYSRNRHNYYTGPRADDIRRETRQAVQFYDINRTSRPSRANISGNKLDIYAPSRSSRGSNDVNAAPRNVVRGEGYATARPDRGDASNRPSRGGESNNGINNGRGNDAGIRDNATGRPSRSGVATPDRSNNGTPSGRESRVERPQQTPQTPAQREDRGSNNQTYQRTERPQRQQVDPRESQPQARPEQPRQMQPQPVQPQPQRQERPVQQAQPQRQQPQPQPQRIEQSRPSRGSESGGNSRGSEGGGSSSSRPTRGSRG